MAATNPQYRDWVFTLNNPVVTGSIGEYFFCKKKYLINLLIRCHRLQC